MCTALFFDPINVGLASVWKYEILPSSSQARNLLKKSGEKIPIELLNGIGLLHFEKGELEVCYCTLHIKYFTVIYNWWYFYCLLFQMAEQSFKEALGDGFWVSIIDGSVGSSVVNWSIQYRDQSFFQQLEEEGTPLELPWDKVTTLFNYARLFEELHDTVKASLFYRLIIFKVLPFPPHVCHHAAQQSLFFHIVMLRY